MEKGQRVGREVWVRPLLIPGSPVTKTTFPSYQGRDRRCRQGPLPVKLFSLLLKPPRPSLLPLSLCDPGLLDVHEQLLSVKPLCRFQVKHTDCGARRSKFKSLHHGLVAV